jgi:hypothetical protein
MANASTTLIKPAEPAAIATDRMDRLSDRLSPIVIKEVRQMVRGREFNYSFALSLFVGLIIAFVSTVYYNAAKFDSGNGIFILLMICLGLVGLVVSPLGAFSALRNERVERTLDLVTITTLSPRRIVIGKLAAQTVKLVMLFAGLAPFVAMSFLLGGVDFVTIVVWLAVLFMWSLWACAATLFLSCVSKSRTVTSFIFGAVVFFILIVFVLATRGFEYYLYLFFRPSAVAGMYPSLVIGPSSEVWTILITVTCLCVISGTNLVLLAENRLQLPTEDRSTALRIGFLIQQLFIIGFCIYMLLTTGGPKTDTGVGMSILGGWHLMLVAFFAVTEDIGLSRRIVHQLKTGSIWRRLWFFHPGGSGGAVYVLLLMILLLIAAASFLPIHGREFSCFIAICGYICLFTGVPTLIVRKWGAPRIKTVHLRVGIILLILLSALLPDIFAYMVTGKYGGQFAARHVFNPFKALYGWYYPYTDRFHMFSYGLGLFGLISYLLLILLGWKQVSHDTSN